jgi:hypothetical protein
MVKRASGARHSPGLLGSDVITTHDEEDANPITQEDRDRIRTVAMWRADQLRASALDLDLIEQLIEQYVRPLPSLVRSRLARAAEHLRQLAEGG